MIEHRVHIDVEPVCPHDCHGALEFLPAAPVGRNGYLLVLAADIIVIERIEAGGEPSGRPFRTGGIQTAVKPALRISCASSERLSHQDFPELRVAEIALHKHARSRRAIGD